MLLFLFWFFLKWLLYFAFGAIVHIRASVQSSIHLTEEKYKSKANFTRFLKKRRRTCMSCRCGEYSQNFTLTAEKQQHWPWRQSALKSQLLLKPMTEPGTLHWGVRATQRSKTSACCPAFCFLSESDIINIQLQLRMKKILGVFFKFVKCH